MKWIDVQGRLEELVRTRLNLAPTYDIRPDTKLSKLGMDSANYINFVMECEKDFDVAIPDYELEHMNTINDALITITPLVIANLLDNTSVTT